MSDQTEFVWVPREPTEAMLQAWRDADKYESADGKGFGYGQAYRAMLSAAPTPPAREDDRAAFEAWASHQDEMPLKRNSILDGEGYAFEYTAGAWLAWQARAAQPGWQPIESAPKDGKQILLAWCPGDWTDGLGFYSSTRKQWMACGIYYCHAAGNPPYQYKMNAVEPLFWHPLPPAPVKDGGGE